MLALQNTININEHTKAVESGPNQDTNTAFNSYWVSELYLIVVFCV